jgi:hypothetical protein
VIAAQVGFRRFGGTTKIVVLDNLKEGVLTPDIYDPALNPLYRDMLAHYGVVAVPCRVGDPDRKGKVEAGIGHTQKTPLPVREPATTIGGPTLTSARVATTMRWRPVHPVACSRGPLHPSISSR